MVAEEVMVASNAESPATSPGSVPRAEEEEGEGVAKDRVYLIVVCLLRQVKLVHSFIHPKSHLHYLSDNSHFQSWKD